MSRRIVFGAVGEQGAAVARQEGHPLHLVWIQARAHSFDVSAGGADACADLSGAGAMAGGRGEMAGVRNGVRAEMDVAASFEPVGEAEEVVGQPSAKQPRRVECLLERCLQVVGHGAAAVQSDARRVLGFPCAPTHGGPAPGGPCWSTKRRWYRIPGLRDVFMNLNRSPLPRPAWRGRSLRAAADACRSRPQP